MKNPQKAPVALSRSVCVVEVTRDRNEPAMFFQCLISIPGHPSTFSRTWPSNGKPVHDAQITDLLGWVQTTVFDAIAASVGVQGRLDDGT